MDDEQMYELKISASDATEVPAGLDVGAEEINPVGIGMETENSTRGVRALGLAAEEQNRFNVEMAVHPGSAVSAARAEAWAVGQMNGTDVPSDDITYHNNAKWYAGQARADVHVEDHKLVIGY